ncbi:MAG: class I tRNA ligase family protein [Candidatus Aminicenantes bacterium]|jgi:valyl-tRNA synthetase
MEKTYNLKEEKKWYKIWEEIELFKADNQSTADPFSTLLPPANANGTLHMGHALTFTITDIIVRRKKMQGFNTLWLPGLVPAHSAGQWLQLVRQLGLALDWSRMKSSANNEILTGVNKIFVKLYNQGKIYRESDGSTRWFLKTAGIVKPAIEAVKKGEITFIPGKWAVLYIDRMDNIRDWCISRQLQGAHPIPAYYCKDCDHLMVEEKPPGKCCKCNSTGIEQDPDTLDPWFSTALWPFTIRGWQENSQESITRCPTSLVTIGIDMIFSWLAPMIMIGLHLGKHPPLREILVNGLIRDKKGTKTDNTNVIHPLKIIEEYGADPLRFTLAVQAVPEMDTSLSFSRVKGCQTFTNKIWNASRYVIMNLNSDENFNIDFSRLSETDKWILHALNNTIVKVNDFMDNYRVNEAADLLYYFFWHEYCDWYLEFSKNDLHNPDTRKTLKFTLYKLLQMLHPFMPFITEELYQKIKGNHKRFLLQTGFPAFHSERVFNQEFIDVEVLKKVVNLTRKTRTENKIDPNHRIRICLKTGSKKECDALTGNMKYFDSLTRSAKTEIVTDFSHLPKGFKDTCLNWEILLPFDNDQDRLKELTRLKKELEKIKNQVNDLEKRLCNDGFVKKTPGSVVLNLKKNLQETIDRQNKIQKIIDDLS